MLIQREEGEPSFHYLKRVMACLELWETQIGVALSFGTGSHDFDYVASQILQGKAELWMFPNSVIIMEPCVYPNHNVYHGFVAAGNLNEILDAEEMLMERGLYHSCKYMTIAGRQGWERPLKNQGWKHSLSILQKEIPDG